MTETESLLIDECTRYQREIFALKQALHFYADEDNWEVHYCGLSGVYFDMGDKAREALKVGEPHET